MSHGYFACSSLSRSAKSQHQLSCISERSQRCCVSTVGRLPRKSTYINGTTRGSNRNAVEPSTTHTGVGGRGISTTDRIFANYRSTKIKISNRRHRCNDLRILVKRSHVFGNEREHRRRFEKKIMRSSAIIYRDSTKAILELIGLVGLWKRSIGNNRYLHHPTFQTTRIAGNNLQVKQADIFLNHVYFKIATAVSAGRSPIDSDTRMTRSECVSQFVFGVSVLELTSYRHTRQHIHFQLFATKPEFVGFWIPRCYSEKWQRIDWRCIRFGIQRRCPILYSNGYSSSSQGHR